MRLDNSTAAKAQRLSVVLNMLKRAASDGLECPSNAEIIAALGAASVSAGSNALNKLEAMGKIAVHRTTRSRQVLIIESGESTAAISGKPHWSERGVIKSAARIRPPRTMSMKDGCHVFRGDVPPDRYVDRSPCGFCGTRADIGCKHSRRVAA